MMPEQGFDVHVLRTVTLELTAWLRRLQATAPHASEAIDQLIIALAQTFREVEIAYLYWRHERVQTVLQNGFRYARARIEAAIYRRERGRNPAAFPMIYSSFYYAGTNPAPPPNRPVDWQTGNSWPYGQYGASGPYPPGTNPYGTPAPAPFPGTQHPYGGYPSRNEPAVPPPVAVPTGGYNPWLQPGSPTSPGGPASGNDYPPPPYPPPSHWKPPSPLPGSPPISVEVAEATEVAIRYLEAVGKAVNISVDLNAF